MDRLGQGTFGFVQLAENVEDGQSVAIKFIKRTSLNKYVENEILNHSRLRHPHVIQFREVFLTDHHICIVMEYANNGSLFHYVQQHERLAEKIARWFFQQLVIAVDYCHKKGVANRDIKLENTLLQLMPTVPLPLIKVCDFGYSKAEFESAAKSKVGTLTYMAPEVLTNSESYDGKMADIWSCGVMLFIMLCGKYPFGCTRPNHISTAADMFQMLQRMQRSEYYIPQDVYLTDECRDILSQLLNPAPTKRITTEGILTHPWFQLNLPEKALEMNKSYLQMGPADCQQRPEEVRRVVAAVNRSRGVQY